MSSADDPPDEEQTDIAEVAAAIDALDAEQRHELQALSDTLGEPLTEEQVREIAQEEGKSTWTRGGVLAALGGAAGAATAGTAGAATGGSASGSLSVASITANTYRIAGDFYGGPASARSELTSELGSSDAGAKYFGIQSPTQVKLYHWTGSAWEDGGVFNSANPTVDSLTADVVQTGSLIDASSGNSYDVDSLAGGGVDAVRDASKFSGSDGGSQIQAAIDDLPAEGGVVAVPSSGPDDVSGNSAALSARAGRAWLLTSPITIPSDVTLVLYNAYLFLEDAVDDNIIRNSDLTNGNPRIKIVGLGQSVIDGNATNQTLTTNGPKRVGLRFYKCDNLELSNFIVRNTNGWGIKPEDCDDAYVHHIWFSQDGSKGNQDGVHLVGPCQGNTIETIRGVTGDDATAVSAEYSASAMVEGGAGNVTDVTLRDISVDANTRHQVRILAGDGYSLQNVRISDVHKTSGGPLLRIGGSDLSTQPSKGQLAKITAQNLTGNGTILATQSPFSQLSISNVSGKPEFRISNDSEEVSISNVTGFGSISDFLKTASGITVDGLTVGDISVAVDSQSGNRIFNLDGTVSELQISDAAIRQAGTLFDFIGSVTGQVSNIAVDTASIGTIYGTLGDVDYGPAVPPLASGTFTLSSGSTGIKTAEVTGVTTQQGRQIQVELDTDEGAAPAATYAWRQEPHTEEWDETNARKDVTLRANLVTDPGSNLELNYQILPGEA